MRLQLYLCWFLYSNKNHHHYNNHNNNDHNYSRRKRTKSLSISCTSLSKCSQMFKWQLRWREPWWRTGRTGYSVVVCRTAVISFCNSVILLSTQTNMQHLFFSINANLVADFQPALTSWRNAWNRGIVEHGVQNKTTMKPSRIPGKLRWIVKLQTNCFERFNESFSFKGGIISL